MERWSIDMNATPDWSNCSIRPGDLVHVYSPYHRNGGQGLYIIGLVISLNKPPVGSLQIFDAQVLVDGSIINVYRHDMYRITDDSLSV
jgi:hypothetical protein